jgi:aminoglycoside phosphotransferase (APT) family kinase protein
LGARVPFDNREFRYEPDIIKEVFAVTLVNQAQGVLGDAQVAELIKELLEVKRGTSLEHPRLRRILYFDWTRTRLPYPFFFFEWVEGTLLWEQPVVGNYEQAGALLASLHRVQFENFYENIFNIHHVPRSWTDHLRICLNRELARAEFHLPDKLVDRLNRADFSVVKPGRPCLVHNDFSGANVLFDQSGAAHIIDWDNWVVDCAELDLVKMKYWTAIGRDGFLGHRSGLFDAFLAAYNAAAPEPASMARLKAYEHLWLLRCFNFEKARASAGEDRSETEGWRHVYPGADFYLELLSEI